MILKQLNLNFLSKLLGVESFKLFKSTYHSICDDGHFENSISDKEKLSTLLVPGSFGITAVLKGTTLGVSVFYSRWHKSKIDNAPIFLNEILVIPGFSHAGSILLAIK